MLGEKRCDGFIGAVQNHANVFVARAPRILEQERGLLLQIRERGNRAANPEPPATARAIPGSIAWPPELQPQLERQRSMP